MKLLLASLLSLLSSIGLTELKNDTANPATEIETKDRISKPSISTISNYETGLIERPQLVKYPAPIAMESFWNALAKCETNSDWQNGGQYAGGLGIYTKGKFGESSMGTWERWGGEEFAPSPDKATKEQQIIVANRIATLGWETVVFRDPKTAKIRGIPAMYKYTKDPVGFTGWGCYKSKSTGKYRMAKPKLVAHVPETVIKQKFTWGQKGVVVSDLQAILDVKQTGVYDTKTYAAHITYVMKHKMIRTVVPVPKIKFPKTVPTDPAKRCPQYEKLAFDAGFPSRYVYIVSYLMWKESRCITTAINSKDPKGGSRGLMQINASWHDELVDEGIIKKPEDLFTPSTNMKAAFYVWIYALKNNRYNYPWQPWSLY